MESPLVGVRVLLVAAGVAPGLAARRLAFMGAVVVARAHEEAVESSALDALDALVRDADVLIVDGPVADRGAVGAETACASNPALVWCAMTPYGDDGPMAGFAGSDTTVGALAGALRSEGGEPEAVVRAPRLAWATELAATRAVGEITAALYARTVTGRGARVEVTLVDPLLELIDGPDPTESFAFVGVFATGDDRFLAVEVAGDRWAAFCDALGLFDIRGYGALERRTRRDDITERVTTTLGREACAAMLERLLAAGVAATPALTRADARAVPHLARRWAASTGSRPAVDFASDAFPPRPSTA